MLEFRFPDIGEGIAEGVILKWFVDVGQEVKEGDSLFLVETDKVNAEIPAPRGGIVLARFGQVGETINVGDVVVTIGDDSVPSSPQPTTEPVEEENAAVVGALETSSHVFEASSEGMDGNVQPQERKVLATPVARKLAKDLGVDMQLIEGSGPAGRIMKEDIQRAAKPQVKEAKLPSAKEPWAQDLPVGARHRPLELEERVALTSLGKTVAKTMSLSKQEIPHAAIMDELDVTELVKLRQEAKEVAEKEGVKLTYMPFIIKAIVLTLQANPHFNASFSPETQEVVLKKFYNIGIAVDTPHGLVVPVVKNAHELGLLRLGEQVQLLAEKARERTLSLDEIQGGTFTLTNYGAVGALSGLPVIKHPEAAILGIGTITKKPVVDANDQIVVRQILPITLAFDHRFIDGGQAGRFVNRLRQYLEEPLLLLLG